MEYEPIERLEIPLKRGISACNGSRVDIKLPLLLICLQFVSVPTYHYINI